MKERRLTFLIKPHYMGPEGDVVVVSAAELQRDHKGDVIVEWAHGYLVRDPVTLQGIRVAIDHLVTAWQEQTPQL